MEKKIYRQKRIEEAINKDFKKLLLVPFLILLFLRFIPPLIKPFLTSAGSANLYSEISKNPNLRGDSGNDEKVFILLIVGMSISSFLVIRILKLAGNEDDEKDINPSLNLIASDNRLKIFLDTIFGRHQIFKNSHRNWPELQAAFAMLSLIITLTLLVQISWCVLYLFTDYNLPFPTFLTQAFRKYGTDSELAIKTPLSFISIYFAIYVYIKKDYSDKWKYCADIYYKLSAEANLKQNCALAVDILYLDLWAKRGFCRFFHDTVVKAVKKRNDWDNDKKDNFIKNLSDHKVKSGELEEVLSFGLQNF